MKTIRAFIKRHPLLSFYALVFAISWGGMLIAAGPDGIQSPKELGFSYVAMLMAASLWASWTSLTPLTTVLTGMPLVTYYLVFTAALWVVIGAIALVNHGHLSRQPPLRGRVA